MPARRRYRALTLAACTLLGCALPFVAGRPTGLDGPLLDVLVALRAAVTAPGSPDASPVAIVAIDARSLDEPELALYPRTFFGPIWAEILDALVAAGARAVGFDLLLSYTASRFAPDFDRPFVAALARHRDRVVLGRSAGTLPAAPFLAVLGDGALGMTELVPDADGAYRRVSAGLATREDGELPTLAGAVLQRAAGIAMPPTVVLAPRRHLETIPTYALIDVLRCARSAPPALARAFSGRLVLVGTTLPDEDRRASSARLLAAPDADGPPIDPCGLRRLGASAPHAATVPGVFVHAGAVEAVVTGRVTAIASPVVVAVATALAAGTGAALGLGLAPWTTTAVVVALAAAIVTAATGALAADLWVPVALPLGASAGAPALAYVVRYLVEDRARRRIQHAFSHYLAPALVDRLALDPSALRLGGEAREVTVMFADLSGFTALSGRVSPEVLTRTTNRYLALIVAEVEATGGYVDKFIGDAVMALWGAPLADPRHAANAVRAARRAVERVLEAHARARARGEVGFTVKIGLNSGPAVVGNVGTERRYNYTAVGETVNVASRLESVPGLYECPLVAGPGTAALAADAFLWLELDRLRVKGREAPLAVFQPLADAGRIPPELEAQARRYGAALSDYRAMRFADAARAWDALALEPGPISGPARAMAARARALALEPPVAPWDGTWTLTSK